jgi:hypothetical protein
MARRISGDRQQPEMSEDTWGSLVRYGIRKFIDAVFSEKLPRAAIMILGVIAVAFLGYVALLPVEERSSVGSPITELAAAVDALFRNRILLYLGWGLFVVSILFFGPVVSVMWNRIQAQGEIIKKSRDKTIKNRVSSRNPDSIREYDDNMKNKFGGRNDTERT